MERGTLGSSHPIYLRTVAQIFPSKKAAVEDQRYFASTAGRNAIVTRFLGLYLNGTFEPRAVHVRRLAVKVDDSDALVFPSRRPRAPSSV